MLVNDESLFSRIPDHFLWTALNFPHPIIRLRTSLILQARIDSPFGADFAEKKPVLAFIGKIKERKINDLTQKLNELGIQTAPKPRNEVTHVIVGEESEEKLAQVLKMNIQLVLPQHLIAFLANEEKPYLLESSPQIKQNLEDLLLSEELPNLQLAVQIMLEGGIPDELFYHVILKYLSETGQAKKTLKKLIDKYLNPAWVEIIRKYGRKAMPSPIKLMLAEAITNKKLLLKSALAIFERGDYRNWLYGEIIKICFASEADIVKMTIEKHLQGKEFHLEKVKLTKLPSLLRDYPQIEILNLHNNKFKKIPKVLTQLPQLKILDLSNNQLIAEPERTIWQTALPQVKIIWRRS
jgi:hypothetical protein